MILWALAKPPAHEFMSRCWGARLPPRHQVRITPAPRAGTSKG